MVGRWSGAAFVLLLCCVTVGAQVKPGAKPAAPAAEPTPAPANEPAPAGVRIEASHTQAAQVSRNVTYLQGARRRVEFPGLVTIEQCDLGHTLMLNPAEKRYQVQAHAPDAPAPSPGPADSPGDLPMMPGVSTPSPAKGGVVTLPPP